MMAQVGRMGQHSTRVGQSRLVTATQLKYRVEMRVVWRKKSVSEILRKYGVCEVRVLFLTLQRQGTTPKILKLKFPVHTSGPKQKPK